MTERNIGMDLLRGLMALWIAGFWHLVGYTSGFHGYSNSLTYTVTIIFLSAFFYISGYLLGNRHSFPNRRTVMRYYGSRFARIIPLFFVATAAFWFFGIASQKTLVKGMCLVSIVLPSPPLTLWFVILLINFYLLGPLLVRWSTRPFGSILGLLLVLGGASAWHLLIHPIDLRFIRYFPVFWLGINAARHGLHRAIRRDGRVVLALLAGACASYALFSGEMPTSLSTALTDGPFLMLVTVLLVGASERVNVPSRLRDAVHALAFASFGLYLFHRPVYVALAHLYGSWPPVWQLLYLYTVALPLAFCLAYAAQRINDTTLGAANNLHARYRRRRAET